MKRITILLADDNSGVRKEFRKILELEADLSVIGEAKNGILAVLLAKKLCPHVVLMDISMPLMNGLQATRQILLACPAIRVLMLSVHTDEAYVIAAVNAGAVGYLFKQSPAETVGAAIRSVHMGKTCFSPSIPKRLCQRKRISWAN